MFILKLISCTVCNFVRVVHAWLFQWLLHYVRHTSVNYLHYLKKPQGRLTLRWIRRKAHYQRDGRKSESVSNLTEEVNGLIKCVLFLEDMWLWT